MTANTSELGWPGLLRLALVQTALGAVVVLATSTLNRIMVVELGLPALLPASLVALHYLVQLLRVHHGYRVDVGGRSTPRIVGGMATLAAGGIAAAFAAACMRGHATAGTCVAIAAYVAIGIGVGAAGTANLALLSKRVSPARRPLAAALMWIMMIAGFSISAGTAGHFLQPYSATRLVQVYAFAGVAAFMLACVAIWRVEGPRLPGAPAMAPASAAARGGGFGRALSQLLSDPTARRFTAFLFASMLAFSAQELLLEPFAGLVFGYAPGRSAGLAGIQNAGVLVGMLLLVVAALRRGKAAARVARHWMIAGTVGSAAGTGLLATIAALGRPQPIPVAVFLLGLANGVFAASALGVMMDLSAAGGHGREGLRMGLWGAAQALAFAAGGLSAGGAVDLLRRLIGSAGGAYTVVFCVDGGLFLVATWCALRLNAAVQSEPLRPRFGADAGVVA